MCVSVCVSVCVHCMPVQVVECRCTHRSSPRVSSCRDYNQMDMTSPVVHIIRDPCFSHVDRFPFHHCSSSDVTEWKWGATTQEQRNLQTYTQTHTYPPISGMNRMTMVKTTATATATMSVVLLLMLQMVHVRPFVVIVGEKGLSWTSSAPQRTFETTLSAKTQRTDASAATPLIGADVENSSDDSTNEYSALQAALSRSMTNSATQTKEWYADMETLPFECTGCGKCCQTTGSVWLSPTETAKAASLLRISAGDFIDTYGSHTICDLDDTNDSAEDEIQSATWVRLRDSDQGGCVFLDSETKFCTIYEARPSQCSTYPFWPNLMESKQAWNSEVRQPDITSDGDNGSNHGTNEGNNVRDRHIPFWSPEAGGCEGMKQIQDEVGRTGDGCSDNDGVPLKDARRMLQEYKHDEQRFPRRQIHEVQKPQTSS